MRCGAVGAGTLGGGGLVAMGGGGAITLGGDGLVVVGVWVVGTLGVCAWVCTVWCDVVGVDCDVIFVLVATSWEKMLLSCWMAFSCWSPGTSNSSWD